MDLYLTSAEPGLARQEMIDYDIKGDIDFDSRFSSGEGLGVFDIGAITGLDAEELELKTFEPLFDPLVEEQACDDENSQHDGLSNVKNSTETSSPMASWMNLSAMSNFNLDFETSLMVNPSDVLPSPHYPQSKRHRLSPNPTLCDHSKNDFSSMERQKTSMSQYNPPISSTSSSSQVILQTVTTAASSNNSILTTTPQSPIESCSIPSLSPLSSSPSSSSSSSSSSLATQNFIITNSPVNSHNIHSHKQIITTTTTTTTAAAPTVHHTTLQLNSNSASNEVCLSPSNSSAIPIYQSNRQGSTITYTPNRCKPMQKYARRDRASEEKVYPKPAYSYACLIALALKNSVTGSLPVSEIYSFMCEHFPYFRTAPNGWKNSVRHNLSLNKCFEKIEKPVVSGSNQRKGCLWALNPLKAHKMDEEVQKWSKKDLQGIRDAMTCPEVLESLEKGEMKFEATSGASSCSEDEEEEDGVTESVFLTTDHHHQTTLPIKTRSNQSINGFSSSPKSISHRDSSGTTPLAISSPMGHSQQLGRTISSSSPEPEYILPDSTMPEINIQSNGSLVDDFGNEITLDGDLSILNPRGGTSVSSGGANLILRKVSASVSPLRSSSIRSGFVYTTTSSSNLIPHHQNGLNRLVLTNAKLSS